MRTLKNPKITEPEIAALYLVVFGKEENWNKDFKHLPQYASWWKNSPQVKAAVKKLKLLKDAMLEEVRAKAFEDGRKSAEGDDYSETEAHLRLENSRKRIEYAGMTDYTDPDMQKRKLNEIINKAADSGEALDALKVIIQSQKNDQDAAKDNQVQRFYTPIQCRDCPLYQEKKSKLGK